jgi:RNA polymerase sigma-70 factor, ECF subfamily
MVIVPSVSALSPVYICVGGVSAPPARTGSAVGHRAVRPAVVAEPSDAALAASAVSGDAGAFEMIMRRHYAAVWRVAFLSVREETAAEELAQDTFLRAYGALAGWRGEASLRTWLATICRRLCIDRARLKQLETVTPPEFEAVAGSRSDTEALADRFDLQTALDRLPADDREAFLLVHHYGYSSFETAALLGIPASTVRSRVGRARQRLAAALSVERVTSHDAGWPVTTQEGEPV